MGETRPGPLAPYRVLDLTDSCGQLGAKLLADLGADTVRVEPPGGSPARHEGPFFHDDVRPDRSLSWFFFNANKRGITLNVETEDGRALLRRLVERFDVLFESFPPGYLEGLGVGYGDLSAINPGLVVVSITPFGSDGPYAEFKGSDIVAWAMGGKMFLDGDTDRPPVRVSVPQASQHAGAQAGVGAMIALYERGDSGLGQHVDISVQESVVWTLMIAAQTWDVSRVNVFRGGALRTNPRADGTPLQYRMIWPCKDGFITFVLMGGGQAGSQHSMRALAAFMEREGFDELRHVDWSQIDFTSSGQAAYDEIAGPMGRFFLSKTKAELYEESIRSAIQLAPLHDAKDIYESEQLAAREYWHTLEHPELGETLIYPGPPVKLSETPWSLRFRAPLVGEHNADVYGELGLDAGDLRALAEARAI